MEVIFLVAASEKNHKAFHKITTTVLWATQSENLLL